MAGLTLGGLRQPVRSQVTHATCKLLEPYISPLGLAGILGFLFILTLIWRFWGGLGSPGAVGADIQTDSTLIRLVSALIRP